MHQKQLNRIRSRHWIVTSAFCVGICFTLAAPAPALSKATMQPWCSDPKDREQEHITARACSTRTSNA